MPDAQGFLLPDPEHVQLVGIRRSQAVLRLVTRRDMPEMYLLRGFEFTHEAVREWEERFAPLLAEHLRRKRKGKVGRRWYVDETYVRVKGRWCYLYRAIDREGNLVDSMLSATRDMDA